MELSGNSLRQEIKYKIFIKDIGILYSWIYSHSNFSRSFEDRSVNSLYFDTSNYDFAASNMSGESKRIKVRARWYTKLEEEFLSGFMSPSKEFNFEVKRKHNSLSDKLLIGVVKTSSADNYTQRLDLLYSGLKDFQTERPVLNGLDLIDTVFINYQREYYEDLLSPNLRLTVDKNISYAMSRPFNKLILLSKDYVILELKFNPSDREEVEKLMGNFPFRQVRSSKFLAALSQIKQVSY